MYSLHRYTRHSIVKSFRAEVIRAQIPLTNRVRGLQCKLRTAFYPLQIMAEWKVKKKKGTVTYRTDQENEVSKMFIYLLDIESSWKAHLKVKWLHTTEEYETLNQPIRTHVVLERSHKCQY